MNSVIRVGLEFILFLILLTFALGGISAAPWVPARKRDLARFMEAADIQPGDVVVDLGCGDGRLLFEAMKRGAARAIGYEISLLPLCIGYARLLFTPRALRPTLYFKNFWRADVQNATVIYTFLMPASFDRLLKKLNAELPENARLINYVWELPQLQPDAVFTAPGQLKLYRYRLRTSEVNDPTRHTSSPA